MEKKYEMERARCLRQLYKLHPWRKRIFDFRNKLSLDDKKLVEILEKTYFLSLRLLESDIPPSTKQILQKYWIRLHQLQAQAYPDDSKLLRMKLNVNTSPPLTNIKFYTDLHKILKTAQKNGYIVEIMIFDDQKNYVDRYPSWIQEYFVEFDERYKKVLSRQAIELDNSGTVISKIIERLEHGFQQHELKKLFQQLRCEQLKLGDQIGNGAWGTVFKARRVSGEQVAVKMSNCNRSLQKQFRDMKYIHQKIPEYVPKPYYYDDINNRIIMQYFGPPFWITLQKYLKDYLNESTPVSQKIEEGLKNFIQKLKQHKVRHCDLHPGNILVNIDDGSIKIIDWADMTTNYLGSNMLYNFSLPFKK